jgi:hypothetical protein
MVKKHSVVALVILGVLGGCHQRQPSGLDPRIPLANPRLYENVRDAKDWRNPILAPLRDGIKLISPAIEGGEKTVKLDQLKDSLRELPVSGWPYGRVVGWQMPDNYQLTPTDAKAILETLYSMGIDFVNLTSD